MNLLFSLCQEMERHRDVAHQVRECKARIEQEYLLETRRRNRLREPMPLNTLMLAAIAMALIFEHVIGW